MDKNNEPSRVIFEGEELVPSTKSFSRKTPKINEWVIKYSGGYIKDEEEADYFLIGFVVIAFAVSLFLIFGTGENTTIDNHEMYQEDLSPELRASLPKNVLDTIPYKNVK